MVKDREKINEYFLERLKQIIDENLCHLSDMFLCPDGYVYEEIYGKYEDELEDLACVKVFHGASRLVFFFEDGTSYSENYVVKIPFGCPIEENDINYCEKEVKIYEKVETSYSPYAKYFAECWRAGNVHIPDSSVDFGYISVPVYIMRRADADAELVSDSSYTYWCDNGGVPAFYDDDHEEEVYNCFNHFWGEEAKEEFYAIVMDLEISDLHAGNVGFVNDMPILIDYAGYDAA